MSFEHLPENDTVTPIPDNEINSDKESNPDNQWLKRHSTYRDPNAILEEDYYKSLGYGWI